MLLLEREGELERLDAALARARAGSGGLVVIEGEAGIGKSALVAAVRARAAGDGMRVARARGAELEREFAFGVARQLVEPALHAADDRAALVQGPAVLAARLLGLPGAPADDGAPETADPLFAILHGLYWLVANLAARAALCLAVDDAHWADAPSLRFLNFLRARVDELPVALVVATRAAEPGAAVEQLAALTADPAAEVIRPAPLSGDAVAALLEADLGATPAPAFAAACGGATGGVPFLAHELAARLREEGIAPTADAVTRVGELGMDRVGRWIGTRLGRLPDGAARLARAIAVLERADLAAAGALAGLGEADAVAAAEVLTGAGLLRAGRPLEFAHPLVRRAVYDAIPGGERARAHRRPADLLDGVAGAEGRVAEHLLATEPAGDAWVAERLGAAAARANAAGAAESAAVYLARVLAEPPGADRRATLLVALGTAESNAGRPGAIPHLREAVAAAAPGDERRLAVLALAGAQFREQRFADAVDLLDRDAAASAPATPLAGMLDVAAAGIAIHDAAIAPAHRRRIDATRARADAEAGASPHLLGVAAFIAVLHNEPADVCAALAERALAALGGAMPAPADVLWFNQAAITLLWTERWERLDVLMDAAVAAARAHGDAALLAGSLAYRGWMRLRRGDLAASEADARLALETADLPAPVLYRLINAGVLVETLIEFADLDGAEAVLDGFGDLPSGGHAPNAYLRLGRARLRLAQARPADALADTLAVGDVAARIGIACPSALSWRSEAAQAQAQLGRAAEAGRHAEGEIALARAFGAPRTLGVALRAAGVAAGESGGGAPLLREAIDLLDGAGARLEAARARVELGALLRRGNQRIHARELLEAASAAARECGGTLLAERAAVELAASGARSRRHVATGRQALTASERRVAELAAGGHTNRDIAQMLFVTTRTVEGHLREAYGKLGLNGREGLAAALQA